MERSRRQVAELKGVAQQLALVFVNAAVLLHGHTHVPAWTEFGQRNVCLNPGSLSIPKENSPHSYMILENGVFYWKDVETGEIYHTRVL